MSATVELPYWALVLVLAFAAIATLDRILVPSVRWFFRRRMERAVAELNKRLERPIQPFKLMRRQDMIVRLIYDPKVMEAVVAYAHEEGVPESVAFQQARAYAREIVPAFSAATYFGFAIRVARWLSRSLYKVRLGQYDEAAIRAIDRKAAVVFVMNHRSNMDYVLVTWLAAERSALSYAVGEWARIWPLQSLIRAMGAYFIRRRYSSPLYRQVLARYVQMAVHEGVTQAIFPEGGLSLDGRVGRPRRGLLQYIVNGFDPHDGRDVVFIPVALNYDRVLEDRLLIRAAQSGARRFPVRLSAALAYAGKHLWQRMTGRFRRFGYAAVSFGAPVSLEQAIAEHPGLSGEWLAQTLMDRVRDAIPVLPVPLVCAGLAQAGGAVSRADLESWAAAAVARLQSAGKHVHLPDGEVAGAVREGLAALEIRGIARDRSGQVERIAGQEDVVTFYGASILHLLDDESATPVSQLPASPAT